MKDRNSAKTVIIVLCLIVIAALAGHSAYQYRQCGYYMQEQHELVKSTRDNASLAYAYIQMALEREDAESITAFLVITYGALARMDSYLYAIKIDGSDENSYWAASLGYGFSSLGTVIRGGIPIPGTDIKAPFWEDGVIDENERLFLEMLSADLLDLKEQVDATNDRYYRPQMAPKEFSAIAQGILDKWDPYLDDQE